MLLFPLKPPLPQAVQASLPQFAPPPNDLVALCWNWIQHLLCPRWDKEHGQDSRCYVKPRGKTTALTSWLCSHWCIPGCCWPSPLPEHTVGSVQITVCQDLQLLSEELLPSLFHCREMVYLGCGTSYFLVMDFMTVLLSHPSWLSKSLWITALPSSALTPLFVDGAFISSSKSLLKISNRTGPRIDPCSTALVTYFQVENNYWPLAWPPKCFFTHSVVHWSNLYRRILWQMVLKALLKLR